MGLSQIHIGDVATHKDTQMLFIVVDGQVSIICLIAPKPVPHSVGCGGGGAGAGVGECGFEIALIYASRIHHWV